MDLYNLKKNKLDEVQRVSFDLEKDIQTLMQQINDELEKIVAECPEQWLWEHRRWLDGDRSETGDFKEYLKRHPEFKG